MYIDRSVVEQVLDVLETLPALSWIPEKQTAVFEAITALRTALEQPDLKPAGYVLRSGHGVHYRDTLTDELRALMWAGRPMWTPLYAFEYRVKEQNEIQ